MKRDDQLRLNSLDMAIRCMAGGEDVSHTTHRAAAFLSFLRGTQSQRAVKKAKKRS